MSVRLAISDINFFLININIYFLQLEKSKYTV